MVDQPGDTDLSEGGRAPGDPAPHRRASHLHVQELVVDHRPRPPHGTGLEIVTERADVGVSEHATVDVPRRLPSLCQEALLVDAGIPRRGRRLGQGPWKWAWLRGGPRPRTVVLDQEVLDALHRRVVG